LRTKAESFCASETTRREGRADGDGSVNTIGGLPMTIPGRSGVNNYTISSFFLIGIMVIPGARPNGHEKDASRKKVGGKQGNPEE